MQPVRTQKTVRRRLPEAEVRRRQRARRRQFALLGLAVLLIVLIFAFRHLISTPQQSGADGDTGNSGTSATEEAELVLICRKRGVTDIAPDDMAQEVQDKWYGDHDYHTMYIGEIVAAYEN